MLPKQYRLPSNARLRNAAFYKTPHFSVKIAKNNLPESRFAFIVRKSVDKRAVVRNRIRRVFRSCIEEMLKDIRVGNDMLFLLEKSIIEKSRDELFENLKDFLKEKQLLEDKD